MGRDVQKSQHKRSPAQEAQTRWMGGFRHYHPLQDEDSAFEFATPSSDTHTKRKLTRELAEEKRRGSNSERREKRAKGKVGELSEKVEGLEMVVETTLGEYEALHKKVDGLVGRNCELEQQVRCLTARSNSRARRCRVRRL